MSIDYGFGKCNLNPETGIRYGVISGQYLETEILEKFYEAGLDHLVSEFEARVTKALLETLKEETQFSTFESTGVDAFREHLKDFHWAEYLDLSPFGDCLCGRYEEAGIIAEQHSDGDVFVLESPYYTKAPFCSPCAPGAGYLADGSFEGQACTYCMPNDWFPEGRACPYPYWERENHTLVYVPARLRFDVPKDEIQRVIVGEDG